jgi:hypothetical protein
MRPATWPTGIAQNPPGRTRACVRRHPSADYLERRREHCRLADPHRDWCCDQCRQRDGAGGRRQEGADGPYDYGKAEEALAAETRREPSAQQQAQHVADKERRQDKALLGLGPPELLLHRQRCDRDIHAVRISETGGEEDKPNQEVPPRPPTTMRGESTAIGNRDSRPGIQIGSRHFGISLCVAVVNPRVGAGYCNSSLRFGRVSHTDSSEASAYCVPRATASRRRFQDSPGPAG